MVVTHAEAREVPGVAQCREALGLSAKLSLRLLLAYVSRDQVHVVQCLLQGVLSVAQKNLGKENGCLY